MGQTTFGGFAAPSWDAPGSTAASRQPQEDDAQVNSKVQPEYVLFQTQPDLNIQLHPGARAEDKQLLVIPEPQVVEEVQIAPKIQVDPEGQPDTASQT